MLQSARDLTCQALNYDRWRSILPCGPRSKSVGGLARFGVPIVKIPLPVLESFEQVLHPVLPRTPQSESLCAFDSGMGWYMMISMLHQSGWHQHGCGSFCAISVLHLFLQLLRSVLSSRHLLQMQSPADAFGCLLFSQRASRPSQISQVDSICETLQMYGSCFWSFFAPPKKWMAKVCVVLTIGLLYFLGFSPEKWRGHYHWEPDTRRGRASWLGRSALRDSTRSICRPPPGISELHNKKT